MTRQRPPMRETDLVYAILEFLAARRIMAWRNNTGGVTYPGKDGKEYHVRFNKKGHPDIGGIMPNGRALAIECKRRGKKPTKEQREFLEDAVAHNALAFWTDDMDEAMRVVDLALKGTA